MAFGRRGEAFGEGGEIAMLGGLNEAEMALR